MRVVLTKLSGSAQVPARPGAAAIIESASEYLEQYQIVQAEDGPDDGLAIEVVFNQRALDLAMDSASLPRWSNERPETLVWFFVNLDGTWTSVSRKSVLPVFEELNGLLFYPVQYEGEESSENVFYLGAAPNQQAIPAVDYLMDEVGVERWALLGTDYVYPRTTNKILEQYLMDHGVAAEDIMINYTPFGHSDWQSIVSEVREFGSQGKKTAVVSTINGDANVPFYTELGNQGVSASDIPVVAFSVGEQELAGIDAEPLVGHLAAWNYFMSAPTRENLEFIQAWHEFKGDTDAVTNDPMEAHYIGFNMWVEAVRRAGTTDVDAVKEAIIGVTVPNLTGGFAPMMPNHHVTKPVMIGEIQPDGQFAVVWETAGEVAGDAWSDYLPESANIIASWREPLLCGNYNVETGECSGQNYGD